MSEGEPISESQQPKKELLVDISLPPVRNDSLEASEISTPSDRSDHQEIITAREQSEPLLVVDQETGIHIDDNGQWGGNGYFGEANIQFLTKHRDRIRVIEGWGFNNNKATLFNLEDAQRLLDARDKFRADSNGIYDDGERWGSRKFFGSKDIAYLESQGEKVRSREGVGQGGKSATLFNIDDAQKVLDERNSHPQVETKTGIMEDESGRWGSKKYYGETDAKYLKDQGERVRTRIGRAANGNIATLFNLEDAQKVLDERNSHPQAEAETGIMEDESGRWGSTKYFGDNDTEYLKIRKDMIRTRSGRVNNTVATLFNMEDAQKVLDERNSRPQAEAETGIMEDETGRWGSKKYFGDNDTEYLKRHRGKIRTKDGRASNGDSATLFNVDDALRVLADRKSKDIETKEISPDEADEFMRSFDEQI